MRELTAQRVLGFLPTPLGLPSGLQPGTAQSQPTRSPGDRSDVSLEIIIVVSESETSSARTLPWAVLVSFELAG